MYDVVSLFDGASGGQQAFDMLGIPIGKYQKQLTLFDME